MQSALQSLLTPEYTDCDFLLAGRKGLLGVGLEVVTRGYHEIKGPGSPGGHHTDKGTCRHRHNETLAPSVETAIASPGARAAAKRITTIEDLRHSVTDPAASSRQTITPQSPAPLTSAGLEPVHRSLISSTFSESQYFRW